MNFLDKIFGSKRLSTLKTAAEFEGAVASLEAELRNAVAARDAMEAKREQAIFGDGDSEAIRRQIAEIDERTEWLTTAVSGARKRLDEAREAEAQAERDRKMAALKKEIDKVDQKHGKPRREAYRQYHHLAGEIVKLLNAIEQHNGPIAEANEKAASAGRDDFKISDPLSEARERYNQLARDAGDPYVPDAVPKLNEAVVLPGFWPIDANPRRSPFDTI